MAERSGDVVFRVDQSDNDSDLWDDSALIKAYDKAISCVKGMTDDGSEKDGKNKPKKKRGGKKNKKKKNFIPAQTRWKVGDRCKSVFTEDDMVYSAMVTSINNKKSSCIVRYSGYGNEEEKRLSDLFTESEAEASVNSKAELENGYDSMEWTDHSQSPLHPSGSGAGPRKRSHHPYPPHPPHVPPPHPASMPQPLGYPNPYGGTWYPPHPGPPPPMPPPPPMMSPLPFAPWGSPATTQMMPGWGGTSPHPASQTPPRIPSMPPTPPPHPPLPDDVEDMDKEALHSMLMSWYMSGYHTGYYEGLKKSKKTSDSTTSKIKEDDTTPRRAGQGRQSRAKDEVKEATPSQPDEKSQDISQES
ncbi:survival motor neuron protein-like [Lytechinus variegatus]|uniref:survival motor neuron protein-like n=1 Tax=Lytechinus variegatus TaxID=7654 RepID=UPI001BB1125C|nr:survival motor neuron protein-like [Lytechinus variegatus]XP_041465173.1 survival motor neuron protein-like [Lytechinus variegatus]